MDNKLNRCPNCNESNTGIVISGTIDWGKKQEELHHMVCDACGATGPVKRSVEKVIVDWNVQWRSSLNNPV